MSHGTSSIAAARCCTGLAFGLAAALSAAAHADVVISSKPTQNMSCSAGTCEPTSTDAVLNVSDLDSMLASGNVTVTTTGSGVQANNINIEAPLTWSTPNLLTLNSAIAMSIHQEIALTGQGGLALFTIGEVNALAFSGKGRVVFQNLSSQLTVNGTGFTLVNSIPALSSAIASNPGGAYALAMITMHRRMERTLLRQSRHFSPEFLTASVIRSHICPLTMNPGP